MPCTPRSPFDLVGEDVLITGAGPIGIMAAAVARHVGARHVVITDVNPRRLALAAEVADVVPVDVSKTDLQETMGRLSMKEGFDVGLEMSGAPAAFEQLFDAFDRRRAHRAARPAGQADAWSTGPRSSSSS